MRKFVASKLNMAKYLHEHGCPVLKTERDRYDPKKKIWIFERTERFEMVLNEYHKYVRENYFVGR